MKLTCPSCGAVASLEAWANDSKWRELLQAVVSLPAPLPTVAIKYFSLFRPGKSALTPAKALRVANEIHALVATGYVSVQGKPDRTCPPSYWAQGMEMMIERQNSLQRPLKNHNYLRQVVWPLADQADAKVERQYHAGVQRGDHRQRKPTADTGMSETMRKLMKMNGEKIDE